MSRNNGSQGVIRKNGRRRKRKQCTIRNHRGENTKRRMK